ncbi:hypothetical protein [Streptomyces sp. NPDC052721]
MRHGKLHVESSRGARLALLEEREVTAGPGRAAGPGTVRQGAAWA